MNIKLVIYKGYVLISYSPEYEPNFLNDLEARFNIDSVIREKGRDIKNTFYVDYKLYQDTLKILNENNDDDDGDTFQFYIGEEVDGFYKFNKDILKLNFDLYFQKNIKLDIHFFVKFVGYGYSVFRAFNNFYHGNSLYIVKEKEDETLIDNQLSITALQKCISLIPTQTEMQNYRYSRYTRSLINYLNIDDYESKLNRYVSKIENLVINSDMCNDPFREIDKKRYNVCLEKLRKMLNNYNNYNENAWQVEILNIFKIINPKYIYVGEKIKIHSFVDNSTLYPDIVLVDFNGNIDLIEIKTPKFELFYSTKYRKNYVPLRELQGTCMQLQNYLISLTKTSSKLLNQDKFKEKSGIPNDFELKSTSSKGYIIYGRSEQLVDKKMKTDFQILRNMYSNIIDIITYDDLILRIENIIKSLK